METADRVPGIMLDERAAGLDDQENDTGYPGLREMRWWISPAAKRDCVIDIEALQERQAERRIQRLFAEVQKHEPRPLCVVSQPAECVSRGNPEATERSWTESADFWRLRFAFVLTQLEDARPGEYLAAEAVPRIQQPDGTIADSLVMDGRRFRWVGFAWKCYASPQDRIWVGRYCQGAHP